MQIPLLQIFTFVDFLLVVAGSLPLARSYVKTRDEHVQNFFWAFFALALYFLLISLPAVLSDPWAVQMAYAFGYIPLVLAPIFFLKAALDLFHIGFSRSILPLALLFLAAAVPLSFLFAEEPAKHVLPSGVSFWWEGTPDWLQLIYASVVGILVAGCSFFFLRGGFQATDPKIRARAFFLGAGLGILVGSAILNYVFATITGSQLLPLVSGGVSVAGVGLMAWGIYYAPPERIES